MNKYEENGKTVGVGQGVGFDAILNAGTLWVILNDTREACLNWLMENPDAVQNTLVGVYEYTVLISGQEYVNKFIDNT